MLIEKYLLGICIQNEIKKKVKNDELDILLQNKNE